MMFLGLRKLGNIICCGHNVSEQNQTFFCVPDTTQQMLRARANGETFVSATMCPQQCVLVCQGLYSVRTKQFLIFWDFKSTKAYNPYYYLPVTSTKAA